MTTTQNIPANFYAITPDRSAIIPCHNASSARAYSEGRAPAGPVGNNGGFTYNAVPFVSPTGQYYVEIHAGSQVVRMDVANAQTARHYARNGVSSSLAYTAYVAELNR